MNILSILSFFTTIIYLTLAAGVIIKDRKGELYRTLFLLLLCLGLWSFCQAFFHAASSIRESWFWYRISAIGWSFAPAAFFHFSLSLTEKSGAPFYRQIRLFMYIPAALFAVRGITRSVTADHIISTAFGFAVLPAYRSPWFLAYLVYYAGLSIFSLALTGLWSRDPAPRRKKKQAFIIIASFLGAAIPATAINLFMPYFGIFEMPPIAPFLFLAPAMSAVYALIKYQPVLITPFSAAEQVLARIRESIFIIDPGGNISHVNEQASIMLGREKQELEGKKLAEIVQDSGTIGWIHGPSQVKAPLQGSQELNLLAADGTAIPAEAACSVLNDAAGDPAALVLTVHDLRHTRELMKKVKMSEKQESLERFETLVTSSHDIIAIFGADGKISYITPSVEHILEHRPEQLIGLNPEKYIHPDDVRHVVRLFTVISRSDKKASSRKIRIMHRDGSWRLFEVIIRNMFDTPGVKGIVANMHDITDRKVVEEELRSLYAELEKKVVKRTEELENANRKLLTEIEERKEVEARLRLHGKYLSALHETTLSIMNRLNLPELLRDIIDKAAAMLNAQHGFVAILERDGSALVTQTGVGCFTARVGDRILRGDGAAGIVWETGDLLAIESYQSFPHKLSWPGLESIGPLVEFPLKIGDEVKGVIGLGRNIGDHLFDQNEINLLTQFAELASIALDNSLLFSHSQFELNERKKAEESLWAMNDKYRTIIDSIQEGYFEIDLEGRLVFFNNTLSSITGYTEEELQGLAYDSFIVPAEREAAFKAVNNVYSTGSSISSIDFTLLRKNGDEISVEASTSIIRDIKGNAMGLRGVMRDITRRKEFENSLKYLAHHDTLTDLPNRILFNDRLHQSLALANRSFFLVAVLFLDLDNFKQINDTLGHDIGDLLLREVAARLLKKIRSIDTVARFGGDEFIFLLPEIKNVSDAKRIVRRVHESFSDDFILRGETVHVTASIGISFYPVDGSDGESLLKQADVALYRCKEGGKNSFRFYNEKMNK